MTSANNSVQSHLMAFTSEESRKLGKNIDMKTFIEEIRKKQVKSI